MMEISAEEKAFFPINTSDEFIKYFTFHLKCSEENGTGPNLAFLSILLGYLEYNLTLTKTSDQQSSSAESDVGNVSDQNVKKDKPLHVPMVENIPTDDQDEADDFPIIELDVVETLYTKFAMLLKGLIDRSSTENTTRSGYATKELCKKVSDVMWNRLNPHYHKDKAHIQSLFSFLTGRELDCFGLAFVVVAACQILKYNDVHLALSEDHAWAAHGDNSKEMTEITWHGKGTEDKRGFSLDTTDTEKSWMYLHRNGIICDRMMEVAAMVVSVNPAIDTYADSKTLSDIQHELLKFIYKNGALNKYPMGLGLLAELDDSARLHEQAVMAVEEHYKGSHVFPFCTQGHFCLRHRENKKAIHCWSEAAQVLSNYNYTREDEEVYKEIMEIAGESIPKAMRNDPTACEDKDCFMDVIRFYDGICLWEEESPTPVLHSWWAKYFTNSVGRFTTEVREAFRNYDSDDRSTTGGEESDLEKSQQSRKSKRHSLRNEEITGEKNENTKSILGVKSMKMKGLEELLVKSKKINAHAVSLQLTAQSQTQFAKRKANPGEYAMEYSGRIKKPKKFFE